MGFRSEMVIGASERASWPNTIYSTLREHGFDGKIYPINPNHREAWGAPCYPGFAALPEPVEHAAVIVPSSVVLPTLEDGTRHGLKSATVYTANIGEGRDPDAIARGAALKALCAKSGLAVSGPNCMGANAWRERSFFILTGGLPRFAGAARACGVAPRRSAQAGRRISEILRRDDRGAEAASSKRYRAQESARRRDSGRGRTRQRRETMRLTEGAGEVM